MPSQRPRPSRRSNRGRATFRPTSLVPQLRRRVRTRAFLAPSARPGVPILRDQFGDCRLLVEIGFAIDTNVDPAGWVWTDVTTDVQVADGAMVDIFRGRGSEAERAQPATCSFRLDNRTGKYSTGTVSTNWPYVRRNTPVRVSIDPDVGVFYTRFIGFADSWPAMWDESRQSAWVELSASGTLRRISQGARPVQSSLRRSILDLDNVVGYWPAEDGKNSPTFASGLTGHPPMTIIGSPQLAASTVFECSDALPVMKDGAFRGVVPPYTGTGEIQVRFLLDVPESGHDADFVLLSVQTTGTAARWDLQYRTGNGGSLAMVAYSRSGNQLHDSGDITFAVDGTSQRVSVTLDEVGADVTYVMYTLAVGFNFGQFYTDTVTGRTVDAVSTIAFNPDRASFDVGIGQFTVQNDITDIFEESQQLNANVGDVPQFRFVRLCEENTVWYILYDNSINGDFLAMNMGSQLVLPLLELLRECEDADGGIMYDGHTEGLTFRTLKSLENQTAALTLDAAGGDIDNRFRPVDDDSRNTNRYTASRRDGISVTLEDTDGYQGTEAIGLYDGSGQFNIQRDARVIDLAGWELNLGTVAGYRFPSLDLTLTRTPELAAAWAGTLVGDRIDVENVAQVLPQLDDTTLSFLLVGESESISQYEWRATAHLAPYGPYDHVGELAEDTGDTNPRLLRVVTDGSTLAASVTQGASSMSVATASGPLWTRTSQQPDDFPLTVSVQGIDVVVTAISGSTSPQTFTVTSATVTRNLSAGQVVELADPPVLGR